MKNWDALVKHLEQRWDKSRIEVCEQLIITIRYAIFTPLDSIRVASNLLKEDTKSSRVQDWAKECYQNCQFWIDAYWEIQNRCQSNSNDKEKTCKCILQGVVTLLANSVALVSQGNQVLDLDEQEMDDVEKILLRNLSTITQIHLELQSQNLSWLLTYINHEDELRGS